MNDRIKYLVQLAQRLQSSGQIKGLIQTAGQKNTWFVPRFVQQSLDAIIHQMLDEQKLRQWLSAYQMKDSSKTIGLIMAGNLPLVGFHDFLCCYVAGCGMKIKLSSKDDELFPVVFNLLAEIDTGLKAKVEFVETLKGFDAVIATGSDNTNRYFEYYFRPYPKILRRNRNSVAILNGKETDAQLHDLAQDLFLYFGFGCRNVSKLYVPTSYDVRVLFPHFADYKWMHEHNKFMNNYDYQRTILMLNKLPHLANEFIMLCENPAIPSPIATLNYEFYSEEKQLQELLDLHAERIQCVVSGEPARWKSQSSVAFGQSQHPELWDYADGVDTVQFLMDLG
ncbi:MAG: acyl-CoA reductase [Bacteroidetes bacterium]|nr:acyl-CoA reductase [Bacteroidota bacterium]